MDEARAACASISPAAAGRAHRLRADPAGRVGNFEHEAAEEFLRAVAGSARLTLHLGIETGANAPT
jgi:imidazoleglycerol phosphate dehydratase HisB